MEEATLIVIIAIVILAIIFVKKNVSNHSSIGNQNY